MKHLRRILASGCIICSLFTLLFYIVAAAINLSVGLMGEIGLSFPQFLLIFLFSFLIAGANRLFSIRRIRFFVRLLLHYAALLVSFLVVFVASGKLKLDNAASVFLSVILFTLLYAASAGATFGFLRAFGIFDRRFGYANKVRQEEEYRPRYRS